MKHNWEYKRLGDTCKLSAGGDKPDDTVKEKTADCVIPVYSNGIENEGLYGYCKEPKVFSTAVTISGRGTLGTPFIRHEPFVPIIRLIVAVPTNKLEIKFLYYWILNRKFSGNGGTIPQLTVPMIKDESIPVPPIAEQERIVAELDALNGTIAKCRELLATLDSLAQSLFYDIFGDPNTLTKHTKVSFGAISINLDSKRRPVTKTDRISGIFPYYGASGIVDYVSEYIFDGEYLLISEDGANLISRTQPIAFLSNGKVWINNHAHVVNFDNPVTRIFSMYYLNLLDFSEKITGMAQPKLTQKALNEIMISWPPLALQEEFARKIEAIEAEKKKVEATMAEVQTLLDSRMDYWFN